MAVQMRDTVRQDRTGSTVPERTLHLHIEKSLRRATESSFALSMSMEAMPGVTVLFGASGAGKSTVLNCVAGLLRPDAGRISIGETVLFDSATHIDVAVERRRIGYVFQNLALFPHLSAWENVAYGIPRGARSERKTMATAMLERMRIAHLADRRPRDISGGERQRVALARALVTDPAILLLDEPLSGLDLPTKTRIVDDLRSWNDQHAIPVLYVSHSREEAFSLAEHVVVLDQGRVLAHGSPFDVFKHPQHELTAQLSGFENIFDASFVSRHDDYGTMTCSAGGVQLELPLARTIGDAEVETVVRVAIRAGDILVATSQPEGLSARNVIPGRVISITKRDASIVIQVDCGIMFEVHVTPHAADTLGLRVEREIWLVMKTHSFHILRRAYSV